MEHHNLDELREILKQTNRLLELQGLLKSHVRFKTRPPNKHRKRKPRLPVLASNRNIILNAPSTANALELGTSRQRPVGKLAKAGGDGFLGFWGDGGGEPGCDDFGDGGVGFVEDGGEGVRGEGDVADEALGEVEVWDEGFGDFIMGSIAISISMLQCLMR